MLNRKVLSNVLRILFVYIFIFFFFCLILSSCFILFLYFLNAIAKVNKKIVSKNFNNKFLHLSILIKVIQMINVVNSIIMCFLIIYQYSWNEFRMIKTLGFANNFYLTFPI